jgi:hypothetical protein
MGLDGNEIRALFDSTEIVRIPRYGIVKGYHELPYVCIGESFESGYSTTRVKGTIQVSPQFVIRPSHYNPSYEDLFGEDHTDQELKGRMFGFMGFHDRPVECKSDHLELKHVNASKDRVLSETLDELERFEDITTGVIISPNAQYFPVSVEKFISTILEDEFSH